MIRCFLNATASPEISTLSLHDALPIRLGRDSRKWNTCVLAASQNPSDVLGMEVSNFIAAAFVGRIEDEQVAADAPRMLRVQPGVGYEGVLYRLSPRSPGNERSGDRKSTRLNSSH